MVLFYFIFIPALSLVMFLSFIIATQVFYLREFFVLCCGLLGSIKLIILMFEAIIM